MGWGTRVVVTTVVVSLFSIGPLASLAVAQQPTPPGQPGTFQEAPKAVGPHMPRVDDRTLTPEAYELAAGVATTFLAPGRVITCALGSALGIATLAVTFGTGYDFATRILEEGCGGRWVVTGRDLVPEPRPLESQ